MKAPSGRRYHMAVVMPGGRRTIDRVLDPSYLADLGEVGVEELRRRRREAMSEEADLSYLRRMLQGRIEVLQVQLSDSGEGIVDEELVARLTAAMVANVGGGVRQHSMVEPERVGDRRRYVERLIADIELSAPEGDEDTARTNIVAKFTDVERSVSEARRNVHRVIDVIADELASRYRSRSSRP
jgi:hypothetical protein